MSHLARGPGMRRTVRPERRENRTLTTRAECNHVRPSIQKQGTIVLILTFVNVYHILQIL